MDSCIGPCPVDISEGGVRDMVQYSFLGYTSYFPPPLLTFLVASLYIPEAKVPVRVLGVLKAVPVVLSGAPGFDALTRLASLSTTPISWGSVLCLWNSKTRLVPVQLHKNALGCIWVSEKTPSRILGE
jgi:hypothetical protein